MKATNTVILREVSYDKHTGFITLNNAMVVQRFGGKVIDGAYLQPINSLDHLEIMAEYQDVNSDTKLYEVKIPEDNLDTRLPEHYAEIEYPDMDTPEAIDGARFDDMNYSHYMER